MSEILTQVTQAVSAFVLVTTETKSSDFVACERVLAVYLSCASRGFFRVLAWFSSLSNNKHI